jgi:hypothetical protein
MTTTTRTRYALLTLLLIGLLSFTTTAPAQTATTPKNLVRSPDGKWRPAPGFDWVSSDVKDLRVRWMPGSRHSSQPNIFAGPKENTWSPARGYKWANNTPGDLRVVRAGPSDEEIGRGVVKVVGALALHKASMPRDGEEDTLGKAIARGLARLGRDKLIDSAFQDLFPNARAVERASVRNLVVLALDGRLSQDRDQVLAQLRRANPDMADAMQVAEFLIRIAQAVEKKR